tara:strand:- start:233 stop:550 length:318 start_codon:yes stop_codon:yes gene_type:complete
MEYIGINSSKQNYGKKNLLYCQMEILTILKKIHKYKKLRKQEFALKNILRKEMKIFQKTLKQLDDILPETKKIKSQVFKINHSPKKRKDLESEIENIKRKIAELH